jgi:hypothetical protein
VTFTLTLKVEGKSTNTLRLCLGAVDKLAASFANATGRAPHDLGLPGTAH